MSVTYRDVKAGILTQITKGELAPLGRHFTLALQSAARKR